MSQYSDYNNCLIVVLYLTREVVFLYDIEYVTGWQVGVGNIL